MSTNTRHFKRWISASLAAVVLVGASGQAAHAAQAISNRFTVRNTITTPAVAPHQSYGRMCTTRNVFVTPAEALDEAYSRAFTARAVPTSIEPSPDVPVAPPEAPLVHRLHPCQPNPFNPIATIRYDLPEASQVSLHIYDVSGRRVRVLVDRADQKADWHVSTWDGRDDRGRHAASGIYLYELRAGTFRAVRRMVLLR